MLRNLRTVGPLGVCMAAAVALSAPFPASAATAPVTTSDATFTLYAKEVPGEDDEEGEQQAPGVGDSFAFADDLYRTKGGEKVGRDGVVCTVVRLGDPGDVQCVGTFVLSGGQITGQVIMPLLEEESEELPTFDIAITGGTGDYRAARGHIHSTDDGNYQRLDFHVRR
ncbi:hypothetical protein [Streptomyces sp. 2A115]|uniref:hypothetical protein n=1 Tax=Streptomyces sp. 2A115 TaxID=3457439 RepID=UPI003FD3C1EA